LAHLLDKQKNKENCGLLKKKTAANNKTETTLAAMTTSARFEIALAGFSTFERSAFESFFRLSARRALSYVRTESVEQADALIVDTDCPQALAQASSPALYARTLCVGSQALPGNLGQLPRPINMMAILKTLDAQLPALQAAHATLQRHTQALPLPPAFTAVEKQALASNESYLAALASMSTAESTPEEILVVDDSDVALRFMAQHLHRYGFRVNLCHSGAEALAQTAARHYAFVFMDVNMPGMDGYAACKRIKQQSYPNGRQAPAVVMLTSRGGAFDKLRGTLAGCDAYLTKPLSEEALLRVIGDHITALPSLRRLG
jgi:two-component system cell cycle response regulator